MESDPKEQKYVPSKWPQIIAATVASVGGLALGATLAWSSPALPNVTDRGDLPLTDSDKSWIAAIVPLGALVSGPVAGFGIERFGRKRTLIMLTVPFVLSNLIVAFSDISIAMMMVGRFLTGFCAGLATLAAPVYIAEIATNEVRGTLGSIFNAALTVGTVGTFLLGAAVNWVWLSIIHAGIPVLLLLGMIFVPESPIYLILKGDIVQARKSYKWLRGAQSESQIEPELQFVKQRVEEMKEKTASVTYRDLFKHGTWQPTLISLSLVFYNQMSGITALLAYSNTIVRSTGADLDPNVVSAVLGSVVIVSTFFMDKAGRRTLLFISSAGMSISFVVIGLFYFLNEQEKEETGDGLSGAITWMPLIGLFFFNFTYNLGIGPLPRVISTEILPQRVRGLTLAVSMSLNWIMAFVVTKTFLDLMDALNESGYFWLYAGVCATGLGFTYFFVPETKGKSIAEIENLFQKRKPENHPKISVISGIDLNANEKIV